MTATSHPTGEGLPPDPNQPTASVEPSEPAAALIGGLSADRCAVCDAELAPDQRYCVECGTRRGRSSLPLATATAGGQSGGVAVGAGASSRSSRSPRGLMLAAIVALLLALGVGILIGQSIAPTVHVTVSGAGLVSSASTAGTGAGGSTSTGGSGSTATGGGSTSSSKGTSTTCTKGTAGCVKGHQTGNLFGSGGG